MATSFKEDGGGDRNRTCDPGLMSPLLYQLSYAAERKKGVRKFYEI
jgi:hypothetical protein